MKNLQHVLLALFIIAVGMITILPLLTQGLFPMHDATQVARVYQMQQALLDGNFPVRVVPDLGYGVGYPIFTYYAPLPYYIGALFTFLTSPLIATKMMIIVAMVLSGISMFVLAKKLSNTIGAIYASVFYTFAPYHAVNLYVRGAISELYAFAFLPLAFYGLLMLHRTKNFRNSVVAGLFLACVLLSHNITSLMLVPFYSSFFLYVLIRARKEKKTMLYLFLGPVFALLFSAFYVFPAIVEMGLTNVSSLIVGGSVYSDHFVCFSQLWSSQWGYAGSAPGCLDGMSYQIGKLHIIGLLLSIGSIIYTKRPRKTPLLLLGATLVSILLVLPISKALWDTVYPMRYIQFPWRFLQFIVLFSSLFIGISVGQLYNAFSKKKKVQQLVILGFICFSLIPILYYVKFFEPQFQIKEYQDQTNTRILRWDISKISDEYLPRNFIKPESEKDVVTLPIVLSGQSLTYLSFDTDSVSSVIVASEESKVILQKADFPFWKTTINGQRVKPKATDGVLEVTLPKGKSTIEMTYESTLVQKIANAVSLIGIASAVVGIMVFGRKSQKR